MRDARMEMAELVLPRGMCMDNQSGSTLLFVIRSTTRSRSRLLCLMISDRTNLYPEFDQPIEASSRKFRLPSPRR